MVYRVIGLMSGSSLDGLDIVYATITDTAGKWEYDIEHAACIPYPEDWKEMLRHAAQSGLKDYLQLDVAYGEYVGSKVNAFIQQNNLFHKVHFISSHGHTVYHDPETRVSAQIGNGAAIAATTGFTVINNLRNIDVALGGEGAPIVPIADRILFNEYDFCLNIGGIANITINQSEPIAFDICPANQLLNHFAEKEGKEFDENGDLASKGIIIEDVLQKINRNNYYSLSAPKSLDNSFSLEQILPYFYNDQVVSNTNGLRTSVAHISQMIQKAIMPYSDKQKPQQMLVTGGGALNQFLISQIQKELSAYNIQIIIPDQKLIIFKEALAMALIGILRWREEDNVLSSVTGAQRNSCGGAMWLGV
jgi:anhydro-N-acetylmuramic acid kinase